MEQVCFLYAESADDKGMVRIDAAGEPGLWAAGKPEKIDSRQPKLQLKDKAYPKWRLEKECKLLA
jgi:hypothetical protein